jgi:hypothetical protein
MGIDKSSPASFVASGASISAFMTTKKETVMNIALENGRNHFRAGHFAGRCFFSFGVAAVSPGWQIAPRMN